MSAANGAQQAGPRKRIWVQHVAVETDKLQMRVEAARARGDLSDSQEVVAQGVSGFIRKARAAAFGDDPIPGRWANWWRGTLVESAYRNMHTARAQLVDLYDEHELRAEIPMVVARANATLHRDDPRRMTVAELEAAPPESLRPRLRRLVGDSYEQMDLEHAQLRSFRNIVFIAAFFIAVIVGGAMAFVAVRPELIPLCFANEGAGAVGAIQGSQSCPSSAGVGAGPQGADILVVAVLGALGGALAVVLSIRNLKGTSTPYDVPVALAALKVPMGALTAILALVAIQGGFIPGLSVLDSQGQILAYALVFGFAQQALSRLLDQRAQTLLEGLPGGSRVEPTPGSEQAPKAPKAPKAPTAPTEPGRPTEAAPTAASGGPEAEATDESGGETPATGEVGTGDVADLGADRPVEEPAGASQQDQFDQLRDTGNERRDMSEDEEAALMEAEFGPPDARGIYGAPPSTDPPVVETSRPSGEGS